MTLPLLTKRKISFYVYVLGNLFVHFEGLSFEKERFGTLFFVWGTWMRTLWGTFLYIGRFWAQFSTLEQFGGTLLWMGMFQGKGNVLRHIYLQYMETLGAYFFTWYILGHSALYGNVLGHISFYWYTFGAQFFILIGFEASFFGCGRFRPIVRYEVHFFV